jgi:glycosyltransferase involved in cell wall biosynthesis
MATVCLAVMAKNEAHVLARCLASARSMVQTWLVLDTGSTDGTGDVAREAMKDLPGEVVERPWKGFGASRTELLELARNRADYTLVLDADDALEHPDGARFPELDQPAYALLVRDGPLAYWRLQLFSSALPWRYEGALHELAVCDGAPAHGRLEGVVYQRIGGGARSQDPEKYLKDAELLEDELRRDPSNPRTVFYLARSYEDAGNVARALGHYERRALMGGWEEEVYCALFHAARAREVLAFPKDRVVSGYVDAWSARPQRAEPLYRLAVVARESGDFVRARAFATAAQALPFPRADSLFIHHEIYAWRALDELAAACARLSDWAAAVEVCRMILARPLPPEDRARIEANLASCEAARAPGP